MAGHYSGNPMFEDAKVKAILADPCVSYWLKDAINTLLLRDPVDAARDAEVLASLMHDNEECALGRRGE